MCRFNRSAVDLHLITHPLCYDWVPSVDRIDVAPCPVNNEIPIVLPRGHIGGTFIVMHGRQCITSLAAVKTINHTKTIIAVIMPVETRTIRVMTKRSRSSVVLIPASAHNGDIMSACVEGFTCKLISDFTNDTYWSHVVCDKKHRFVPQKERSVIFIKIRFCHIKYRGLQLLLYSPVFAHEMVFLLFCYRQWSLFCLSDRK